MMEKKVKKVRKEEKKTEDKNLEVVSDQLKKQITKKDKRQNQLPQRGLVYIKNLPHGFFEPQLKKYFKQFGKVTRVRLGRSLKTGNSRGWAFVEFEIPEVAEIAAQTMNNYLMFKKIVKAKYISPEEQKHNYFKSSVKLIKNKVGKEKYVSAYTLRVGRQLERQNNWTEEVYQKRIQTSLQKLEKLKEKYADLGIDFDNIAVKPDSETLSKIKALEKKTPPKDEAGTKKSKKSKKNKQKDLSIIGLEALLGDTLNEEDSSDDEFIPNENDIPIKPSEPKKGKKMSKPDEKKLQTKKKDVTLRALLEDTLNDDDSSDEEFVPEDVLLTDTSPLKKSTRSKGFIEVEKFDDSDIASDSVSLEDSNESENENSSDGTQESEELEFENDSESDEDMPDSVKIVQKIQVNQQNADKKNQRKTLVPLNKLAAKLSKTKKGDKDTESDTEKFKSNNNKKVLLGRINKKTKKPMKNAQNSLKEKLKVDTIKELLKNQSPSKVTKKKFKKNKN